MNWQQKGWSDAAKAYAQVLVNNELRIPVLDESVGTKEDRDMYLEGWKDFERERVKD